jgi:hypothetical protein
MRQFLSALAIGLLLVKPALGQDFDKGRAAFDRGDYTAALRECSNHFVHFSENRSTCREGKCFR